MTFTNSLTNEGIQNGPPIIIIFRRNRRVLCAQLHMNPVLALSPCPSFHRGSRSYLSINSLLFAYMFCVYVRKYTCTLFPLLPSSLLSCLIGRPSSGHSPPPRTAPVCFQSGSLSFPRNSRAACKRGGSLEGTRGREWGQGGRGGSEIANLDRLPPFSPFPSWSSLWLTKTKLFWTG